jgi:hypothetical protein
VMVRLGGDFIKLARVGFSTLVGSRFWNVGSSIELPGDFVLSFPPPPLPAELLSSLPRQEVLACATACCWQARSRLSIVGL